MNSFKNLTIRNKLILLSLGNVGLVLLLVTVAFLAYQISSTHALLRDIFSVRSKIFSANLSAALVFDDRASAEETLLALKEDSHMIGAWVYTKNQDLFAQYDRNPAHPVAAPLPGDEAKQIFGIDHLTVMVPIYGGDNGDEGQQKPLGTLILRSDLGVLYDSIGFGVIVNGSVFLICLLLAYLISIKAQNAISKPILDLVGLTQQVASEKNYALRTPSPYARDELGRLAKAFNDMLHQIETQSSQLKNMNQALELRIEERTSEIRKAEKFLDSIIENIPNMVFIKDAKDLKFIRFNKAGQDLIGYSQEALLGKNDYDFFTKEQADFFIEKDRAVLRSKNILDIPEEPIQTKEKGERILHTKKVPVFDEGGNPQYLLGISEDITQVKQAQVELLQKTEQLARSKMEIEQLELFAFAATHDLKEPLRAIHFYADLLKTHIEGQINEETLTNFNRIQNAADRMSNMMEQMRELSRIGTERIPFKKINLNEIVTEVVQRLEFAIRETCAQVKVGPLPLILGDQTQMLLLFQNLISNSLKFQKKGGPAPVVNIQGRTLEDGRLAEITIEDNGIGFDEKYLERIFKPFQRLHGKNEYAGTGLGLAICRKIIVRHGGKITAQTAPGQGAKFIIPFSGRGRISLAFRRRLQFNRSGRMGT